MARFARTNFARPDLLVVETVNDFRRLQCASHMMSDVNNITFNTTSLREYIARVKLISEFKTLYFARCRQRSMLPVLP